MKELSIAPLKGVRKFHSKQSVHEHMPEVPFRLIALGNSGSGKTLTLQNMLLNHYKGVFTEIYLWSPTSRLDMGWEPVFKYMARELGQNPDSTDEKDQCVFESFRNQDLVRVIDAFSAKIRKLKERRSDHSQQLPSICLIADDVADDPAAVRNSNFVQAFVKLRHMQISTALLSQKWKLLSPTIRINLTAILCWRLRDLREAEEVMHSLSGTYGFKQTWAIYKKCTEEPYSFMYYDALKNKFYCRFEYMVQI